MKDSKRASGVVEAALPRGLFRVRLEDGRAITATLSTEARRVVVKLLPGDEVTVKLSPVDPTRGRIERKQ